MSANRIDEELAECWTLRLEVDEVDSTVTSALDEDEAIIGLAAAGATRDPDAPTAWELYSINVVAHLRGSGLADDLMRATVGDRDVTLWVAKANARAIAFYGRHGFTVEGATKAHEATGVPEMRMARRSGAAARDVADR